MFEDLFYQRLIKLRTEKGVSARDMSLSIGQSPGYINSLENRNGFPSMQVFFYGNTAQLLRYALPGGHFVRIH